MPPSAPIPLLHCSLRQGKTLGTLMDQLAAPLKARAGPGQHAALAVVGALAKRVPDLLGDGWEQIRHDLTDGVGAQKSGAADGALVKARCKSQRLAIKLLANEVLGASGLVDCADEKDEEAAAEVLERIHESRFAPVEHMVVREAHAVEAGGALVVDREALVGAADAAGPAGPADVRLRRARARPGRRRGGLD